MNAWWLLFTGAMLASPLVFALCVRTDASDPDTDTATAERKTFALVMATIGAIGVMLAVWRVFGVRPAVYTWPLFFPLFFFLAAPAMRAKNPAWGRAHQSQPSVRTASITGDRARTSPVPRWVWVLAWSLCIAGILAIALRPILGSMPDGDAGSLVRKRWLVALVVAATAIPTLLLTLPLGIRAAMREPEPMDTARSPELARAYASLRNTKAWFFAGLFLTMAVVMTGAMAALAWVQTDQAGTALGWAGGIGGSLIGLAGAAGGIYMDTRRVRVNRLLRDLERDQRHPATA